MSANKSTMKPVSSHKSNNRIDGYQVEAVATPTQDENQFKFHLSVDDLPVPTRRYVSDYCFFESDVNFIKIFFCEKRFTSQDARTCLQIKIKKEAVRDFVNELYEADKIMADQDLKPLDLPRFESEPDQYVKLVSNVLFVSTDGSEACIDFYHISPFNKTALKNNRNFNLGVEPIVRVDLETKDLERLFKSLCNSVNK
ncbi:hypothetical protein ABTK95_04845 [Acinetobacter baumannii]|nr:hypothetical protein [Acinetobacter baumannii]